MTSLSLRSKRFRGVREQESQRNGIFGVLPGRKRPIFRVGNTPKIPFPRSFFAPKPHGNACYAGQTSLRTSAWEVSTHIQCRLLSFELFCKEAYNKSARGVIL